MSNDKMPPQLSHLLANAVAIVVPIAAFVIVVSGVGAAGRLEVESEETVVEDAVAC
jgi:hypothetical protein